MKFDMKKMNLVLGFLAAFAVSNCTSKGITSVGNPGTPTAPKPYIILSELNANSATLQIPLEAFGVSDSSGLAGQTLTVKKDGTTTLDAVAADSLYSTSSETIETSLSDVTVGSLIEIDINTDQYFIIASDTRDTSTNVGPLTSSWTANYYLLAASDDGADNLDYVLGFHPDLVGGTPDETDNIAFNFTFIDDTDNSELGTFSVNSEDMFLPSDGSDDDIDIYGLVLQGDIFGEPTQSLQIALGDSPAGSEVKPWYFDASKASSGLQFGIFYGFDGTNTTESERSYTVAAEDNATYTSDCTADFVRNHEFYIAASATDDEITTALSDGVAVDFSSSNYVISSNAGGLIKHIVTETDAAQVIDVGNGVESWIGVTDSDGSVFSFRAIFDNDDEANIRETQISGTISETALDLTITDHLIDRENSSCAVRYKLTGVAN